MVSSAKMAFGIVTLLCTPFSPRDAYYIKIFVLLILQSTFTKICTVHDQFSLSQLTVTFDTSERVIAQWGMRLKSF